MGKLILLNFTIQGAFDDLLVRPTGMVTYNTVQKWTTLPRCKSCGRQVPMGRLSNRQYTSDKCKKGEERRLRCETLQFCFEESRILFYINTETLSLLEEFPYLGHTIAYNTSNWAELYLNLCKARRRWGMIVRVIERTGAIVRDQGEVY